MANALTNEMRPDNLKRSSSSGVKIAVFGAGGQIGTKLRPLLINYIPER